MATHEVPEWETPQTAPKHSFFRFSNPFNNLSMPRFCATRSFFSKKSPSAHSIPPDQKESELQTSVSDMTPNNHRRRPSRKCIMISTVVFICLLALIIGLAVGLRHKSSSSQDLPLPSNKATFTGDLTYYQPGLGACGITSSSDDSICAVSHILYDAASTSANPNSNPLCGKKIRITRYDASVGGNRSVDVTVVDRCVGCKATDLDLSLKMFTSLADQSLGRVTGSWAWLD